ncbi:tetratricopeptide repeat protein [Streptomyces sp. NEAU-S77]|uniref:tetratricopeptide repeat protein n=1 Tax=Streptomyces sp. NEAU-S77 TaxID=3411033 RepID=UPI003BA26203
MNRVLGPDHPDTLTIRNDLAVWRGEAGDAAGAAATFTELLADHIRVLGPDHPHILRSRDNLARWRGEAETVAQQSTDFEQDQNVAVRGGLASQPSAALVAPIQLSSGPVSCSSTWCGHVR